METETIPTPPNAAAEGNEIAAKESRIVAATVGLSVEVEGEGEAMVKVSGSAGLLCTLVCCEEGVMVLPPGAKKRPEKPFAWRNLPGMIALAMDMQNGHV